MIIVSDGDSEDCRLHVIYKVKINHQFVFFKLVYGLSPDVMDNSNDLTAFNPEPYPAYNSYSAMTPPLPVKNGDTIYFATWYLLDIGTEAWGGTLLHTMTRCNQ